MSGSAQAKDGCSRNVAAGVRKPQPLPAVGRVELMWSLTGAGFQRGTSSVTGAAGPPEPEAAS